MPGDHPDALLIQELGTDVVAQRNGVNLFRGRVGGSTDTVTADGSTVNFTAVDYRGLLDRRLFWTYGNTLSFRGVDQANIAWQIIQDAQTGQPGGNLGITRGAAAPTGVLRDRDYEVSKPIGEAITQLGQVVNGFEWEINALRQFNLFYPQRGRATGITIAYGKEVTGFTRNVTSSHFANAVRMNGSPDYTKPVEIALGSFDANVGRWDAQRSDANLVLQTTVNERAQFELTTGSALSDAFNLTMTPGWWDPAQVWLGDTIRLIIQTGRLAVDTTRRVVAVDITLDDDGGETVRLSVGDTIDVLPVRLQSYDSRIKVLERGLGYIPDVPVGGMFEWPGQTPPQLHKWCDGTVLQTADYPDLFAVIGTTFGSSGPGTFALPDCRGRATIATGAAPGLSGHAMGQKGGAETVGLGPDNTGAHGHSMSFPTSGQSAQHGHTFTSASSSHGHPFTANNADVPHSHTTNPFTTATDSPDHNHGMGFSWGVVQLTGGGPAALNILLPAPPSWNTGGSLVPHAHAVGGVGMSSASILHGHVGTTDTVGHGHTGTTDGYNADHAHTVTGSTAAAGLGTPHENMPPYIAIGKVIKVQLPQDIGAT